MAPSRENVRRGGRGRDARRREFTVFVDNLPQQLDQYGLKGIFRKAVRVNDVYIPFRKAKRMRKFSFVRFWSQGETTKGILMLNKKKNEFRDNSVEAKNLRFSQEDQQGSKILHVEVNSEFISWLNRSFVCTSDDPKDLGALARALISGCGQCTKIYSFCSFKFILTFPMVEQMEEALNNHQDLYLWFSQVKGCDKYEYCETRSDSFESARILIVTNILHTIYCDLILSIGDLGYRVLIREIGPTIQAIQTVQTSSSSSSMEAMDSNEGPEHHAYQPPSFGTNANDYANNVIDGTAFLQIALEDGDFPPQQLEGELSRPLDNSTPETLKKNKKVKTTYKRKLVASRRILTMQRKIKKILEGTHQLAKDALEIAKILGVLVIDKEDAAIKRITTSLKKERKARAEIRPEA
ncbi:hypothetical protein Cgig2_015695 [Carnegiea gigantea]|uniref:RRM domain-containing protein n=1 Tax=Carnegiea gigantea TaxID=171969 RepID=A0A9Q1GTD3_9CARY|nr:hypothetical protein Cgig2_015695 [Carnegiea gigantea]